MRVDWWTLALQTVNFAVLVWLLQRFLYRPVQRMIGARRAEVDKQYAAAGAAEAQAQEQLAAVACEREHLAAERDSLLKAAMAQADAAAAARRVEAERDARVLLDDARKTLAAEREQAVAQAHALALELGVDVASRLLADVPAVVRAAGWLKRLEQHLAALPDTVRDSLRRQLAKGAALRLLSAEALPAETTAAYRSVLEPTLGVPLTVLFEVEPRLIAGIELQFPNAILRFSWQRALADVRASMEAHEPTH